MPDPPALSVVVATHNRPSALLQTLRGLREQTLSRTIMEVIVVDDGSQPPLVIDGPPIEHLQLLRRPHGERSSARNHGALHARGSHLLFLDDDLEVSIGLAAAHLAAQTEWPGCLAVGAILLPPEFTRTAFGAFRQALESHQTPRSRGPVEQRHFCTAGNMSIRRKDFIELGGFDSKIVSAEDQDFALRHSERGGRIVYVPEAIAMHHDTNTDIRSYCRRVAWGAEHLAPFCNRYPDLAENAKRFAVNGPLRWSDTPALVLKKVFKAALGLRLATESLFKLATVIEERRPSSRWLPSIYRLLLGIHLQKGFRRGWHPRPRVKA